MSTNNEILGYKYQIYEGDDLKIYRTNRFKDYEHVVAIEETTREEKIISKQDIKDKYVRLIPDAFMNIMITDQIDNPDVYVCVNKADKLIADKKMPDIILRQAIYDDSITSFDPSDPTIHVGDCISTSTLPSFQSMKDFMQFKKIDFTASIALYVDDTVDTIIDTISAKILKRINEVLIKIKKEYEGSPAGHLIVGCADNLKDLMLNTYFLSYYRMEFNIRQLDWPIDLGPESHDKNGDLFLSFKQHQILERELRKFIGDVKVIKYAKDIDISRIVSRTHLMVSDSNGIIYLIAYNVIGDFPVDPDIEAIMKH